MNGDQLQLMDLLNEIRGELRENTIKTEQLLSAFPGADIEGHRRYHESVIQWRETRNKLIQECLMKVAQAGTLAGFGWVALALWRYFKLTIIQ